MSEPRDPKPKHVAAFEMYSRTREGVLDRVHRLQSLREQRAASLVAYDAEITRVERELEALRRALIDESRAVTSLVHADLAGISGHLGKLKESAPAGAADDEPSMPPADPGGADTSAGEARA